MSQKPLLVVLSLLALVGAALGIYWWQRPAKPAGPAATNAATTTAPAAAGRAATFTNALQDNGFGELVPVELTESKAGLAKLYKREDIAEFYQTGEADNDFGAEEGKHTAALPAFNYNQPLAGKSYLDLLLLRNELYARNGYCFRNSTARGHFDQYPWYRPVWNYDTVDANRVTHEQPIPVPLNRVEAAFAQKIHAQELVLLAHRVVQQGGYPMLGMDFVVNQRNQGLTPAWRQVLATNNFAIVPTREEQLFYLYDQNEYDYMPSFVTSDLILQLLHKYLNGILSDVEEVRLAPIVARMLTQGTTQAQALAGRCQNPQARQAAEWATAYYAIGRNLLTGSTQPVAGQYAGAVPDEVTLGTAAENKGSAFLEDSLFEYKQLKPRGEYTRNDTTRRYFRTLKWLNTAPVFLDSDQGVLRAVALAQALAASPGATQGFADLGQVLDVLVGNEDNRSLTNLLALLRTRYAGQTLDQLAAPATLASLRQQLLATGTDRIRPRPASAKAVVALARPTLLFTAGRYTFDGEVLARLVDVFKNKPTDQPKRPFPKGLDAFAAFGNRPAQDLLLSHYQEATRWPAYPDSLRAVQAHFAGYKAWNQNLYTKTMQVLLSLNAPSPDPNPPYFARTPAWQRRNLSTALGGWTELKHDLLLYSEQPMGAEMGGGGGGPPAPHQLGYVEPNLPFWQNALGLLDFQQQALRRLHANTPHLDSLNRDIYRLVSKLEKLAAKEVAHQPLNLDEMNDLSHIGGQVESLTLRTLKLGDGDPLPERERRVALVADVYAYNGTALEEAVGAADALFVVVDLNGMPVLMQGAVFSYYEFTSPSPLTDEEWRARLATAAPPRPSWLRELVVPVPALNKNSLAKQQGTVSIGFGLPSQ